MSRRYDKRVRPDDQEVFDDRTKVSFFELAERKRQEQLMQDVICYSKGADIWASPPGCFKRS